MGRSVLNLLCTHLKQSTVGIATSNSCSFALLLKLLFWAAAAAVFPCGQHRPECADVIAAPSPPPLEQRCPATSSHLPSQQRATRTPHISRNLGLTGPARRASVDAGLSGPHGSHRPPSPSPALPSPLPRLPAPPCLASISTSGSTTISAMASVAHTTGLSSAPIPAAGASWEREGGMSLPGACGARGARGDTWRRLTAWWNVGGCSCRIPAALPSAAVPSRSARYRNPCDGEAPW